MKSTIDLNEMDGRSVSELLDDTSCIPSLPGIYFVVRCEDRAPIFLTEGTGGHFKRKNPNVTLSELESNWINGEQILYIGKAGGEESSTSLRSRIQAYIRFGCGKPVGDWGGRYIWQLKDSQKLLIKWQPITDIDAHVAEAELIQYFKDNNDGRRPFANLKD